MTKSEFIKEYEEVAAQVINSEKLSPIPESQVKLISQGKIFSIKRGYSEEEMDTFERLFYFMGRNLRPQFQAKGTTYKFFDVPMKRYGERQKPRPCPEWLWEQWQEYTN